MPTEIVQAPAHPLALWGKVAGVGALLGFFGGFLVPSKAIIGAILYALGYYLGKRDYWGKTPAGPRYRTVIDVEPN